jgi:hypothetical protein
MMGWSPTQAEEHAFGRILYPQGRPRAQSHLRPRRPCGCNRGGRSRFAVGRLPVRLWGLNGPTPGLRTRREGSSAEPTATTGRWFLSVCYRNPEYTFSGGYAKNPRLRHASPRPLAGAFSKRLTACSLRLFGSRCPHKGCLQARARLYRGTTRFSSHVSVFHHARARLPPRPSKGVASAARTSVTYGQQCPLLAPTGLVDSIGQTHLLRRQLGRYHVPIHHSGYRNAA